MQTSSMMGKEMTSRKTYVDYMKALGMIIGTPILFALCAVGGCAMILGYALLLGNLKCIQKPLRFIGTNTVVIFAVQKPIISVLERCFEYIPTLSAIE